MLCCLRRRTQINSHHWARCAAKPALRPPAPSFVWLPAAETFGPATLAASDRSRRACVLAPAIPDALLNDPWRRDPRLKGVVAALPSVDKRGDPASALDTDSWARRAKQGRFTSPINEPASIPWPCEGTTPASPSKGPLERGWGVPCAL
eukprot:scaffold123748_cov32-Tisochrysis_lutea.AAC.5